MSCSCLIIICYIYTYFKIWIVQLQIFLQCTIFIGLIQLIHLLYGERMIDYYNNFPVWLVKNCHGDAAEIGGNFHKLYERLCNIKLLLWWRCWSLQTIHFLSWPYSNTVKTPSCSLLVFIMLHVPRSCLSSLMMRGSYNKSYYYTECTIVARRSNYFDSYSWSLTFLYFVFAFT